MRNTLRTTLAIAGVAAITAIAATSGLSQTRARGGAISVPEMGRNFSTVQAAVDAIGGGEGTVLLGPGTYAQCAVQTAGVVHFRSLEPGTAIFDGVDCEGKAALVMRGRAASVDGIIFQNIHVEDLNGSGIHLEHGDLAVSNSVFRNSDEGIITGIDHGASVEVDRSTFSRLGRNDGGGAHSIYVGNYGSITVTRSRFERGTGGHYVKSRAASALISDNSFDDSQGQATNYMIDLPNGSVGRISDNFFVQGTDKDNATTFIALAAEHREHATAGLVISGNDARLAPGVAGQRDVWFIADWSGARLAVSNNRLSPGLSPFIRR